MKTLAILLALSLPIMAAETIITQRPLAIKQFTDEQMAAIIDGAIQMGITTEEKLSTTNVNSITIVPQAGWPRTNFVLSTTLKPQDLTTTVTNNGLVIVTPKTKILTSGSVNLPRPVMEGLWNYSIGVMGEARPKPTLDNFRSITVSKTNDVWQARIQF